MARPKMQRLLYEVKSEGIMAYLPEDSVQQIVAAMKEKSVSTRKLASAAGTTSSVVEKMLYRAGHPIRLHTLEKIVEYLEMKVLLRPAVESEE